MSSVTLTCLILSPILHKKPGEWLLTVILILYEEANLPRKIRLHSFWLLCLPSFNSEQARKGTVPCRFNNGMDRGMVSTSEDRQIGLQGWRKSKPGCGKFGGRHISPEESSLLLRRCNASSKLSFLSLRLRWGPKHLCIASWAQD